MKNFVTEGRFGIIVIHDAWYQNRAEDCLLIMSKILPVSVEFVKSKDLKVEPWGYWKIKCYSKHFDICPKSCYEKEIVYLYKIYKKKHGVKSVKFKKVKKKENEIH